MTEYLVRQNNDPTVAVSITIPDDTTQDAVCVGFQNGQQTYNEPRRNDVARENVQWLMTRTDAYTVTVQE